jgi:hypothetical protein
MAGNVSFATIDNDDDVVAFIVSPQTDDLHKDFSDFNFMHL